MNWSSARARFPVALTALLIVCGLAVSPADARKADKDSSTVTVLLPTKMREYEPTEVKVDGKVIDGAGSKRTFTTKAIEAGKERTLKIVAVMQPNNYTTITRPRSVTVKAGDNVSVDMTKDDPKSRDGVVIRWVPTPRDIVRQMCKLAKVGKEDIVYDLGCGDAITIITAVKDFDAKKGVGIDINPVRVLDAKKGAKAAGVEDRVFIRQGDILKLKKDDIADASVMMLYLADEMNIRLRPMLWKNLKPGTRIVSHRFIMGDWRPDRSITVKGEDRDDYELHLWTITGKEGKKE
jgi:uncharacterized protein (TIGR03000 family)